MEDNLQVLIYIVFGILYLIFGALKKLRKGGQAPDRPIAPYAEEDEETVFQEHEPTSLEELLERYDEAAIRAKRKAADKVESMQEQVDDEFIPVAPQQPVIRNMEEEAMQQMQETERLKTLQEDLSAKARVEMQQRQVDAKLKPGRKRAKPRVVRTRTKSYVRHKHPALLLEQLQAVTRSRRGMQQAVVLSEILNRKEF